MRIGLIGTGTVGEGVLKLLSEQRGRMGKYLGEETEVVVVCDRERRELPQGRYTYTPAYMDVVEGADIVVELIGGVGAAYDIALQTLKRGKSLITANKHLIALHGRELLELAERNCCSVYYEAAVGGGIPVVAPMREGLYPNEFIRIRGILNGTCNYILSKMEEGMTYGEALADAGERGYAEADPTFDVKGIDTGHKISILAYLAWGEFIDFERVEIEGIDGITQEDMRIAASQGKRYKLLGEAYREGERLCIRVSPQLLQRDELLAQVGGVYNALEVEGSYTGKTILYGEGAGMEATAAAVISDIYRVVRDAQRSGL